MRIILSLIVIDSCDKKSEATKTSKEMEGVGIIMALIPIFIYLTLCFINGFLGKNRLIGFWGFFFVSFLATPLVTLLFLLITMPSGRSNKK